MFVAVRASQSVNSWAYLGLSELIRLTCAYTGLPAAYTGLQEAELHYKPDEANDESDGEPEGEYPDCCD